MNQQKGTQSDPKLRRLCLAALVLVVHVIALQTIFGARQAPRVMPEEQPLTWLTLPPLTHTPPAPTVGSIRSAPAPKFTIPPLPELQVPTAAPAQDPGEAVLKDLLSCDLPDKNTYEREERQRCGKIHNKLYASPTPAPIPTESEQKMAQKFARDKFVEDNPLTAPCFSTTGVGFSTRNCGGGGQPKGEVDRMQARAPLQLRGIGPAP